ncbi:MAG TPA: NADP-specific glutamate dehydrogenase [Candidatus Syntrophosphaera thermopropionivorans]|nr:NADP-specific glutamate dehydrogenase [Candidatus Syntrophosphaera thermopropionivorans]HQH47286.1 NADP-specific glutamate dehydrogenase [Candidatus Syntrophosphaera thermopropionivorans]HQK57226.1 NADP-specific glutamate dehydrogenase [Candidatus Syntrophosphaera thermopropionivorans]
MTFQEFMAKVEAKNPGEPEFIQAVSEVVESIWDVYESNPRFVKANVLERLVEPERVIIFRVPWMDDKGEVHVQRGYRVQFNSAIGPYKGGLRFHPSVNLSVLKFLGFEQIFKNSLTSLPLGGGKGGSDFDPRGKSDEEIMRFCQSFMAELFRHIGPNTDVPAGDIGVGAREIGYLFGYYKKLMNEFTGVLTGKGINWGGSLIRPEATGFGIVYFTEEVLNTIGETIKGKRVAVSGFGNVAWGAVQKVNDLGGKVVTLSGPDGYIYDEDGISGEKIDFMVTMRNSNRDLVQDYADKYPSAKFFPGKHPWEVPVDVAMPCATQNELNEQDAMNLINNKCICVVEGANMPCVPKAIEAFQKAKILFAPGKAANAGGVATSGLEMTQNAMHLSWPREEVDARLHEIMKNIHKACVEHGKEPDGYINYVKGANIAGFMKVANAMCDQGLV